MQAASESFGKVICSPFIKPSQTTNLKKCGKAPENPKTLTSSFKSSKVGLATKVLVDAKVEVRVDFEVARGLFQ